jgi:hypothetical protein
MRRYDSSCEQRLLLRLFCRLPSAAMKASLPFQAASVRPYIATDGHNSMSCAMI